MSKNKIINKGNNNTILQDIKDSIIKIDIGIDPRDLLDNLNKLPVSKGKEKCFEFISELYKDRGISTDMKIALEGIVKSIANKTTDVKGIVQNIKARTTQELAENLAQITKKLKEEVSKLMKYKQTCPKDLSSLFQTVKDVLINDMNEKDFSNMYAETITYSLFIAKLESHKEREDFTAHTAISFLKKRLPAVPLLREMFDKADTGRLEKIGKIISEIVEELNRCNVDAINDYFHKSGKEQDPILDFYEPFIEITDKETKKKRGVYYTPKPIVNFIMRSVNEILKDESKFDLKDGLRNEKVHLLDPATGTGTFLVSAIEEIHKDIMEEFKDEKIIQEEFHKIIENHVMKRFYGFEVLMAPYAISHLKLGLLIEKLGYKFNNNDSESKFKVYLTNTLENESQSELIGHNWNAFSNEHDEALKVKKYKKVLAIVGNPPYARTSMNLSVKNKKKTWIGNLIEDYKQGLKEKNLNTLQDDYVKFIRFAQDKIQKSGYGVCAMITANSFLNGMTHRRMRESIAETFDELYIINLHGNSRIGEVCPDGSKDENVFNIKTGVSINIFIKKLKKSQECEVKYVDFWGSKLGKYNQLNTNFNDISWKPVDYRRFDEVFISTKWSKQLGRITPFINISNDFDNIIKYGRWYGLKDIFIKCNSGITTGNDSVAISYDDQLLKENIKLLMELSSKDYKLMKKIEEEPKSWMIDNVMDELRCEKGYYTDIDYRPYDKRKTYYVGKSNGFMERPRADIMNHMIENNLGLVFTRQQKVQGFNHCSVISSIMERGYLSSVTSESAYLAPLFLYEKNEGKLMISDDLRKNRSANLNNDFIDYVTKQLGVEYLSVGRGDMSVSIGAEDIFYYIYGILHSSYYRRTYESLLALDFPRVPLSINKSIFKKVSDYGEKLVNFHILGANPLNEENIKYSEIADIKASDTVNWTIENDPKYIDRKIYINRNSYLEGIDQDVWDYKVGTYQVVYRWIKDRKGRLLSMSDILHLKKVILSIMETIKTMKELDKYVEFIINKESLNKRLTLLEIKLKRQEIVNMLKPEGVDTLILINKLSKLTNQEYLDSLGNLEKEEIYTAVDKIEHSAIKLTNQEVDDLEVIKVLVGK